MKGEISEGEDFLQIRDASEMETNIVVSAVCISEQKVLYCMRQGDKFLSV